MYGWRGADIRNILEFEKDYPEVKIVKLEQNYRCTKKILDAANFVIANNERRKAKRLWTENEEGEKIKFYKADTDGDEAYFIVNEIKKLVEEGNSYRDFAILYRTNAMSRILEEKFVTSSVPYKVVGGLKFYDRKEIRDILAYLKVINNPLDGISLERIINTPKRGIGDATIEKLKDNAREMDVSLYSILLEIDAVEGINTRALNSLHKFISLMNYFILAKESLKVSELINEILEKTGYLRELKEENTPESRGRIENLQELYSAAIEFEEKSEDKSLPAFLEKVALVSDQDQLSEAGGVTLMTLHTAKGLEFPVVFIAGFEEGIFPHFSALEDESEMEEERRLCYVGITRAKERLYLTCARQRMMFGRTMFNSVSSFAEEIPEGLIEDISRYNNSFNRVYGYENTRTSVINRTHNLTSPINRPIQQSSGQKKPFNDEIRAGMKIKHDKFGKGLVIAVKEITGDKQITVHFENMGLKNLLLSSAPIEKL
ncbi:ATP-dependent DNA helicase PcrA [Fervidicella metallireducens AeB]|uniref:ATP-dependent DNA helicase PcrA n=1 Tax=Fervidicella metallireducens AeB TaxID=1403537 RepID=A0A017RWV9_9CLOT|nr:ATP-dependent DNA helicase PcrA [Fervidicella metallireducens AeB]